VAILGVILGLTKGAIKEIIYILPRHLADYLGAINETTLGIFN
jgi:hypothetical protein